MAREEQLQWEKKAGKPAAVAAFLSALFGIAGFFYQRSITPAPQNDAQLLVSIDRDPNAYLVGTILSTVSIILVAPVLYYLFRATRARRPLPQIALVLAIVAPIFYGGVVVASTLQQTSAAHEYVRDVPGAKDIKVGAKADKTVDDKKDSLNHKARDKRADVPPGLAGVSIASTLAIALAFILICLNAMRAGLVGRFLGSLGMVIGALHVFQFLIPPGLVELVWLPALGLIFIDRFPQGRGPAWDSGEAIPWPSAAQKRDALTGGDSAAPARGGWGARARAAEPVEDDDDVSDDPHTTPQQHTREAARPRESSQHPRSKKRKRKRR